MMEASNNELSKLRSPFLKSKNNAWSVSMDVGSKLLITNLDDELKHSVTKTKSIPDIKGENEDIAVPSDNEDLNLEGFDNVSKTDAKNEALKLAVEKDFACVDEILESIGEFKKGQILIVLMCSLMVFPITLNLLALLFDVRNPPWKCSTIGRLNGECRLNSSIDVGDESYKKRCKMNRSSWEYDVTNEETLVTEFDLVCDKEMYATLLLSAPQLCSVFGSPVSGILASKFGRKPIIFAGFVLPLILTTLRSFITSLYQFFLLLLTSAFILSGNINTLYVMSGELVGPKKRAMASNSVWFAYSLAQVLLILPVYFVKTWRTRTIINAAPYIVFAVFWKYIPESLRWLVTKNRSEEAERMLRKIAKQNKTNYPTHLKLVILGSDETSSIKHLFCNKTYLLPIALHFVFFFNICSLYDGIVLATSYLSGNYYLDYGLIALIEIPATYVTIILCDKIGRKRTSSIGSVLALFSFLVLAVIPEKNSSTHAYSITRSIVGIVAKFVVVMAYNSGSLIAMETYPTVIRSQAMSFIYSVILLASTMAPWITLGLRLVHVKLPFSIMTGMCFVNVIICFFFKETKGLPTAETIEKGKNQTTRS